MFSRVKAFFVRIGRAIGGWFARQWRKLLFGRAGRTGFKWALLAIAIWIIVVGGLSIRSGFGWGVDLAFAVVVVGFGSALIALVGALLLTMLRKVPRLLAGFILGVLMFSSMIFPGPLGTGLGVILVVLDGLLVAALFDLFAGGLRGAAWLKRIVVPLIIVVAIAANIGLYIFFHREGDLGDALRIEQAASPMPLALTAPNPAERGPFAVKTLFYGNGSDLRRPEYGKRVAIKTATVDASDFFKDYKGWRAYWRKKYWGFGMDQLPLNARVWYPDGPGPFPLALIVHGNHTMSDFSDPGYEYLGELLASRGFILASIDENFLNGGLFHDPPKQQAVRGWMLLEHLKLWHAWNKTEGSPFFKKVDIENVALMGHSRGGEAAATAALFNKLRYCPEDANIKFDYNFPIQSIVAIAPADGQYKPAGSPRVIENVSYFTIQGASDADVSSFMGSQQWERVRFTDGGPWFKSELYIYRANHGQFNTSWGRSDAGPPFDWFLNLKPLISGEDQRTIGKVYLTAFLEATLHHRGEYLPLFRDYRRGRAWLPDTPYINRYQDAAYEALADFQEDADLTSTTAPGGHIAAENLSIWREGRIPFRRGDRGYNGVFIGWNREKPASGGDAPMPVYSMTLPDGAAAKWKLSAQSALSLSVAVTDETAPVPGKKKDDDNKKDEKKKDEKKKDDKKKPVPTDFTVELETTDGAVARLPLSKFGILPPPFEMKFTKLGLIEEEAYNKASEPTFQTIELPLAEFASAEPRFAPAKLRTIRLRFDRTESRVIILSSVGFEAVRP